VTKELSSPRTQGTSSDSDLVLIERLNQVLSADGFDDFVEDLCEPFYVHLTESTPDHIFSPQLIVSQRINQWDNFRYPQKYPQGMGGGVSLSSVL
jgi:hypothetical protein